MNKTDLGSKHTCTACSIKFYDFNNSPATCPKCGLSFQPVRKQPLPDIATPSSFLNPLRDSGKGIGRLENDSFSDGLDEVVPDVVIDDDDFDLGDAGLGDDDDPLLPDEGDSDDDVSDLIGSGVGTTDDEI